MTDDQMQQIMKRLGTIEALLRGVLKEMGRSTAELMQEIETTSEAIEAKIAASSDEAANAPVPDALREEVEDLLRPDQLTFARRP